MKVDVRRVFLASVFAAASSLAAAADTEVPARATLAVELESLRARLAQQEALIRRLEQSQQSRNDVVAQQQRLIAAMEKRLQPSRAASGPTLTEIPPPAAPALQPEIESLQARVSEQEAVIRRLEEALGPQGAVVVEQQRLIEALQQKIEAMSTAAPPAPASPAVPATAPAPERPSTSSPTFTFNGLLQGWFAFAQGDAASYDTFRLRRSELKAGGQINSNIKWTLMIDPAKALSVNNSSVAIEGQRVLNDSAVNQAGRVLQDAFVSFNYIKPLGVDVGQFKVPLSLEGLQSSATLETVERTLFCSDRARGGNLGDIRDIGVAVGGPLAKHFDYRIGLFNGSGESQNEMDRNDQKSLAGRLVLRPLKGLQVGGSGVWGNGESNDRPRRDRLGAELLFTRGPFKAKAELMRGWDAALERRGYYVLIAYQFRPRLEAVFRVDTWDPDTRLETNPTNVEERDYVGGINYYISQNRAKLQVNYLHKTYTDQIVPTRDLVLFNVQASW